MSINKYLSPSAKTFFKKSQKKITDLRKKLYNLKKQENLLENYENKLAKKTGKSDHETKITLSVDSVVKSTIAILLVFAFVQVLGMIKSIIIIFLIALFLSAAFSPAIDRLQKYRIPRPLGVLIMYAIVIGIFVFMLTSLVPIIAEQISTLALSVRDMILNIVSDKNPDSWFISKIQPLANQIWQNVDQAQVMGSLTNTLKDLGSKLTDFAGNAIGTIFAIFNGLFNMMLVLIITFFMIINSKNTSNFFHSLFPQKYSGYISEKTSQVSVRIGEWIRGQVTLALIMGGMTFAAFSIIGLNYALTLAMVSALAEFVPYLGPFITFASAALIALNQDPVLIIWLVPTYAILQFLEGNILVPLIIGRSVGLNPIIVLFSLLSGATIGLKLSGSIGMGLVGMIIAVPVANIISMFVKDYTSKNK